MLQLSPVDLAAVTGGAKAKGGGSLIEATHLEPVSYAPPPANHGLDLAAQLGLGGGSSGKHSK
jgi:hypothetical protein